MKVPRRPRNQQSLTVKQEFRRLNTTQLASHTGPTSDFKRHTHFRSIVKLDNYFYVFCQHTLHILEHTHEVRPSLALTGLIKAGVANQSPLEGLNLAKDHNVIIDSINSDVMNISILTLCRHANETIV